MLVRTAPGRAGAGAAPPSRLGQPLRRAAGQTLRFLSPPLSCTLSLKSKPGSVRGRDANRGPYLPSRGAKTQTPVQNWGAVRGGSCLPEGPETAAMLSGLCLQRS